MSSAASVAQLRSLPDQTGHAVYWAGPLEGHTYELTRPTDGNVYVRYLPRGVPVGDRPARLHDGRHLPPTRRPEGPAPAGAATRRGDLPLADGGIAVYGRDRPSSVYLAFPGEDVQVEVYDPSPGKHAGSPAAAGCDPSGSGAAGPAP